MSKFIPVDLQTGHKTKAEIQERKDAEDSIKCNNDRIREVPKWLDDIAKEEYIKLVDDLENSNILTNVDIPVVAIVADAISKMQQLNETIEKEGMYITKVSDRGSTNMAEHPACRLYRQYNTIYKQYLSELGLSPSSRAKLGVLNQKTREESEDPLLQILNDDE